MLNQFFLNYNDIQSMDQLSSLISLPTTTAFYSHLSFFDSSFVNVSSVSNNFSAPSRLTFYPLTPFNH